MPIRTGVAAIVTAGVPILAGSLHAGIGLGVALGAAAGAGCLALLVEPNASVRRERETASAAVGTAVQASLDGFAGGLRLERVQLEDATAALRATFDHERSAAAATRREAAERASAAAVRARANGEHSVGAAQGIGEAVGRLGASVTVVEEASRRGAEMLTVSETVDAFSTTLIELADQAKLVSLNATIEVARSGRKDSSVAVFADELRSLAERMREAGRSVTSIAERLREHARAVTTTMAQSGDSLTAADAALRAASDGLRSVIEASMENLAFLEAAAHAATTDGALDLAVTRVQGATTAFVKALGSAYPASSTAD